MDIPHPDQQYLYRCVTEHRCGLVLTGRAWGKSWFIRNYPHNCYIVSPFGVQSHISTYGKKVIMISKSAGAYASDSLRGLNLRLPVFVDDLAAYNPETINNMFYFLEGRGARYWMFITPSFDDIQRKFLHDFYDAFGGFKYRSALLSNPHFSLAQSMFRAISEKEYRTQVEGDWSGK